MATIIPTVRSKDLSITIDSIAHKFEYLFFTAEGTSVVSAGLELVGETLSLDGLLDNNATYDVQRLEESQGLSTSCDWGYYARQLTGTSLEWFKVWVRWNAEEDIYDYYLNANAGEVFSHGTPYIGIVY